MEFERNVAGSHSRSRRRTHSEGRQPAAVIPKLRGQMKLHELKDSPDDLARYLAVVKQVKRVRRVRVIHQGDRQVTCQSLQHEVIETYYDTNRRSPGEVVLALRVL